MNHWLCLTILAGITLTIQGCGNSGGITGTSCSCTARIGHETRSMNLNFQESDITALLKVIGYYGIEGVASDCCGPYGEDELIGRSNSLDLERLNNNRLVVYSSQTYIVFGGLYLPDHWTLQLWINPSISTSSGIIMEENINYGKALFLSLTDDNNKLSLNLPPSDGSASTRHLTRESSSSVATDTWQHIAVTVSESEIAFYINGELDNQQGFDNSAYNSVEARSSFSAVEKRVCFGSCQLEVGDTSFQGKIDNIEFINRVVSAAEILHNYQNSLGHFTP